MVQVTIPAESRSAVSIYGFCKQGTTTIFDIKIFNLDAGSCLCMVLEKALENTEKDKKYKYVSGLTGV